MKKIKLIKLELSNYRNIEHEVFVFDGSNAKIVGENRIGKTNTLEAIYFLLSNYLLDGSSELSNIKPLSDKTKEVRVEGTFEITKENGSTQILKIAKSYGEKWTKQRGTNELSMQGHYEEYFVNDIKQTREKDYYELIGEYFGVRNDEKRDIDPIQMLINPLYLGNLGDNKDWIKLRNYIVKLIGDVDDEEVFEKEPSLDIIRQDLINALGRPEQVKKMYAIDVDTLNNQLVGFDSQIELLEKTSNPTDIEVQRAKEEIDIVNNKIIDIKSDNGKDVVVEQLESELLVISKEIVSKNQDEFNEFVKSNKNSEKELNAKEIDQLYATINSKVNDLTNIKIQVGDIESKVKSKEIIRNNLLDDYKKVEYEIKNIDLTAISECPTCHRPFSKEEVKEKSDKIVKDLNTKKDYIVSEGKKIKDEQEQLNKQKQVLIVQEEKLSKEIEDLRAKYNELNAKSYETPVFKESNALIELRQKEASLKDELSKRKAKANSEATNMYEAISELEEDKKMAQKVLDDRNYYERQMSLLEGVKVERKNVSRKLILTEQKQEALKKYIYTKLRLLDEHIAKVFGKLRFQLIKENINGGFDPVCKPYIYDVDKDCSTDVLWKNGSKSEKILTGIAIVEAIRKELDLTELPYLFDEGGEISNETLRHKFKTQAQIICVRVEDNILKPIIVKF